MEAQTPKFILNLEVEIIDHCNKHLNATVDAGKLVQSAIIFLQKPTSKDTFAAKFVSGNEVYWNFSLEFLEGDYLEGATNSIEKGLKAYQSSQTEEHLGG